MLHEAAAGRVETQVWAAGRVFAAQTRHATWDDSFTQQVELLDANHSEKGSWGETRIARVSYADPVMLRLARRSYELYEELKKEHREPLMRHGRKAVDGVRSVPFWVG